ncbi:hypothetical protein BOH72_01745 [Mycobacterium sp. WY10]|nr:hypothetical protein BOH72_01745 [Mycobacterium sp. WY10]
MSDSAADIAREIRRAIEAQSEAELRRKGRAFTEEVVEYAKSISPYDPDDDNTVHYKESFKIRARNAVGRLPSWRITNTDALATIIEDGSYERPQGGSSPAHHVFSRTAFHFHGTPDHGGDEL